MTFALACALCLAGSQLGAGTEVTAGDAPSVFGFELESPLHAGLPSVVPALFHTDAGTGWSQDDHGDTHSHGESGHGGPSMMGTTMIVVMVVVMVVVGGAVMMRGGRAAPWPPASGPAALAIPVSAPRNFLSGG